MHITLPCRKFETVIHLARNAACSARGHIICSMDTAALDQFRYISGKKRSRRDVKDTLSDATHVKKEDTAPAEAVSTTIPPVKPPIPSVAAKSKAVAMPIRDGLLPYVANVTFRGMHGRWRERYTAICSKCFSADAVCSHNVEIPLRCLLVGHNPSDHAFQSGFFYSNPTNRMWMLLTGTYGSIKYRGIAPSTWEISKQNEIALELGVGLTDLGVEPGNDAAKYSLPTLYAWREEMYASFRGHMRRCCDTYNALVHPSKTTQSKHINSKTSLELSDSIISLVGAAVLTESLSFAPRIVAFTGKAQWKNLFEPPLKTCDTGLQPKELRPPGWPFPASTQVFVLPSSSGRAAMTEEARRRPYAELADLVHSLPWISEALAAKLWIE